MRFLPLLLLSTAAAQVPTTVTGIPTVTDGDTLQIRGVKVRLHGIDAPECTQAGKAYGCGREAAFALADLVCNKTVTCTEKGVDRYGRMFGVCTVSGTEINRWMTQQGWALPYLQSVGLREQSERLLTGTMSAISFPLSLQIYFKLNVLMSRSIRATGGAVFLDTN